VLIRIKPKKEYLDRILEVNEVFDDRDDDEEGD
jgi:hypothetical protein